MLFPNIESIKLTLKTKSDLSDYLFQDLQTFKNLKKVSLTITDGITYHPRTIVNIETLKVYYKTICANDPYLKLLLRRIVNLKNLTICEAYFPVNTTTFLVSQPIEKLSVKNPYITRSETPNFINTLHHLKLKKLKLIHTQVNDVEAELSIFYIIKNYLNILPHKNLEDLSISLPSCYENINYAQIITKLNKLTKLKIFMSTDNDFNNISQIIDLLNIIPYYLKTTINYYRTERTNQTHLMDVEIIKDNYPQIKVIENINLYTAYPNLIKLEQCKSKVTNYKKAKTSIIEPKPYAPETPIIIHNFPLVPQYNEEIEDENINLTEYLTSDDGSNLEDIEWQNLDILDDIIKLTHNQVNEEVELVNNKVANEVEVD